MMKYLQKLWFLWGDAYLVVDWRHICNETLEGDWNIFVRINQVLIMSIDLLNDNKVKIQK